MAAIVLVPGFLTPKNHASLSRQYFNAAFDIIVPNTKIVTVSPTPVGSLHDRACDIFYELKGGITDYGKEHSKKHGHSRFGYMYNDPLFKEWSSDRPLHIVGHSLGGQTARMLLHLLSSGFFLESHGADASWIKSVTTISSPLNGSMAVYALGAKRRQRKGERSSVVPFSPGFCLGVFIHLYDFMCPYVLRKYLLDFGMDHYTRHTSLQQLLDSIFVKSEMFEGEDSANYDMLPHVAREHNRMWETLPSTYYFSFVGRLSKKKESSQSIQYYFSILFLTFLTWFVEILKWTHVSSSMPKGEAEERWNSGTDGLVTCQSQAYPRIGPSDSVPKHKKIESLEKLSSPPSPGCWYVIDTNTHHLGIVPFPSSYENQRSFFIQLFNTLASLPS